MSRLFSSGFELQSLTNLVEFSASNGQGIDGGSISTSVVRSGSAALRINPSSVDVSYLEQEFTESGEVYLRIYHRIATAPTADTKILELIDDTLAIEVIAIALTTSRTLQVIHVDDSNAQIGSASSALSLDTWYMIEFYVDATGTTWSVTARIDESNFVNTTKAVGSTQTFSSFLVGALKLTAGTHSADLYFDDIAVNDTNGSSQNSWPGEGKIIHAHPNADGDNHEWLKSGGGAGSSTNYQDVDEVTPDDATTYLKRTATGSYIIDDYKIPGYSALGIGASDTINLIQVGARIGATSNTSTNRGGILRIKNRALFDSDDFNRANSSSIGADYTEVSGNWEIVSNKLELTTHSGGSVQGWWEVATYDPSIGSADYGAEITFNVPGGDANEPMVGARYTDTNNMYGLEALPDDDEMNLWKIVGGTKTYLDTASITIDAATSYKLRIEVEGTKLKGYLDDVLILEATDTALSSAGKPVMGLSQASGSIDDFKVYRRGVSESAITDWSVNGWSSHSDPYPKTYKLTSYTNPEDSSAWQPADIDTAQIGFRNAQSSANEIRVSTVWALIEYVPAGGTEHTQSPSETVTLTDSVIRTISRTLNETIALTDTLPRVTNRLLSETVGVIDVLQKTPVRTLSEVITLVDTLENVHIYNTTLSETLTLVDSLVRTTNRTFSETITLVEDLVAIRAIFSTLSETVTIVDVFSQLLDRTFSETVNLTDTFERVSGRILSEAVTVNDTLIRDPAKLLSELITIIDSAVTAGSAYSRTLEEAVALTDVLNSVAGRTFSETLTLTDSIIRIPVKVAAETVTIVDILNRSESRILAEVVTIDDTLLSIKAQFTELTEQVVLTDSIDKTTSRTLSENVVIEDVLETSAFKLLTLTDAVTVKDYWANGYYYRATITIDNTQVEGTSNLTDFPVLISGTFDGNGVPDLRSLANGGRIKTVDSTGGATGALEVPADLMFASDAAGNTPLSFEVESYDQTTGEFIAWVKVPTLLYNSDTVIYLFYSNDAVTTSQEDVTGVWDDYRTVHHLESLTADSSAQNLDLTNNGSVASIASQIGNGADFGTANSSKYLNGVSGLQNQGWDLTISFWLRLRSEISSGVYGIIDDRHSGETNQTLRKTLSYLYNSGSRLLRLGINNVSVGTNYDYGVTLGTANRHHVVIQFSGKTGSAPVKLYIDGSLVINSTFNNASPSSGWGDSRNLGLISSDYASIELDEVKTRASIVSADWINTEINNQSDPSSFYSITEEDPFLEFAIAYGRILSETVTLTDTISRSISRTLSDTVVLNEELIKATPLNLTEEVTLTDSIDFAVAIILADTISVSDNFVNAVSLVDARTLFTSKVPDKISWAKKALGKLQWTSKVPSKLLWNQASKNDPAENKE